MAATDLMQTTYMSQSQRRWKGFAVTYRIAILIGLLLSWIGGGTIVGFAQSVSSSQSIGLGPGQASAGPGETVSYTVTVTSRQTPSSGGIQDAFSGAVSVVIPDGLTLAGQPSCIRGCGLPSVEIQGQAARIQAQFDIRGDESASLSFQVMVAPSAIVGSSYQLTAYLLGGVNTAGGSETAFATLTVAESVTGSSPVDDRDAYLALAPELLRVAPGGSSLYLIRPVFLGDWSANLPQYLVSIRLPSGISLLTEPTCGPLQASVPTISTCEVDVDEQGGDFTGILTRPGFVEGIPNGLYLTLAFDSTLPLDTRLNIDVYMTVMGDASTAAAFSQQSLNAVVVDSASIEFPGESDALSGRLEMASNFSRQGDSCAVDSDYPQEFVLYEPGLSRVLDRTEVAIGRMGNASDGTSGDVCILEFRFKGVPELTVYIVARVTAGETVPCRACILGPVTPGQQAEPVFVRD